MAYKNIEQHFSFADIAINSNADKNHSLLFLRKLDKSIDWDSIETLLVKYCQTGKSREGERTYSPLFLFKCLLLQKWFRVSSDPELESLINDRISFKSFLNMPLDCPSPDHSTFSHFRKRLSKDAMIQINSALKQLEELKQKANTPEGNLDKNGQVKKYSRDLDSDWTVKNDKPHYGFKEHASVDTDHGFVLSTTLTPASHNDSIYLPYAVIHSTHTKNKISATYADKGYAGAPNREFLALNNIGDGIMRKDNVNAKLTGLEIQRNKSISKFRYIVEQYFGIRHLHDHGNKARFLKLMINIIDLMFRQFAFNLRVTFRLRKGSKILESIPV